jgi:hypothetical protein
MSATPPPPHVSQLGVQDWIWTFLWPIGGVGAGALSLYEIVWSGRFHVFGPLIGLGLSGVGILTWRATKGGSRVILGILALTGVALNLLAGVLEIVAVTR